MEKIQTKLIGCIPTFFLSLFILIATAIFTSASAATPAPQTTNTVQSTQIAWWGACHNGFCRGGRGYYGGWRNGYYRPAYYGPRCAKQCWRDRWNRVQCRTRCW